MTHSHAIFRSKRTMRIPRLDIAELSQRASNILSASGLDLRITVGSSSIIIGTRNTGSKETTEFVFSSERTFRRVFRRLRLSEFASSYFDGRIKVNGSIRKAVDVLDAINRATDRRQTLSEALQHASFRMAKALFPSFALRFESLEHYANSAKAYELFLDPYLQYTCAKFERGDESLEEAQIAKFQLIARWASAHIGDLRGKEHLDVGCGWGGMLSYFAKELQTVSTGNTNCAPQGVYASRRFGSNIQFGDFSELERSSKLYNLITVVGMIEHLTPSRRKILLRTVGTRLAPGGVAYVQCITKPDVWIGGDAYRMAQRVVFPGHYLDTAAQTEKLFREAGFEVVQQLDDSRDYGRTTDYWVQNIEKHASELGALLGERQYRVYLGYLAYASKLFSTDRGSLMRYLIRKRAT